MATAHCPTRTPAAFSGLGQFRSLTGFGLDYEQPIGPATAKKLLPAGVELPKMGYEVVLHHLRERDSLDSRCGFTTGMLTLQNISGQLVLASSTHCWDQWETVFGLPPKLAAAHNMKSTKESQ